MNKIFVVFAVTLITVECLELVPVQRFEQELANYEQQLFNLLNDNGVEDKGQLSNSVNTGMNLAATPIKVITESAMLNILTAGQLTNQMAQEIEALAPGAGLGDPKPSLQREENNQQEQFTSKFMNSLLQITSSFFRTTKNAKSVLDQFIIREKQLSQ